MRLKDKRRKLTPEQVLYIRSMKKRAKHVSLAYQFGVSPKTIQRIQQDVYWDKQEYKLKGGSRENESED